MNHVSRITEIANEYYDQEMDSWYYGPCDEVYRIAKSFDPKLWDSLIESTKEEKPDMWRVFVSHAFFDHDEYIGKSQDLIAFQALKCVGSNEAYLIVQYMDNFNWAGVPLWLRNKLLLKLEKMLGECSQSCTPLLKEVRSAINQANS